MRDLGLDRRLAALYIRCMRPSEYKSKTIGIRFTPGQVAELRRRARARGMNVGEHLRDLARRDLEKTVAQRRGAGKAA